MDIICHHFHLFVISLSCKLASHGCNYLNLVADRRVMHFRKIKGYEESDNYSEKGSKISLMALCN